MRPAYFPYAWLAGPRFAGTAWGNRLGLVRFTAPTATILSAIRPPGSVMLTRTNIGLTIEQDELKGFSRTIAEIEWLLVVLVLVYLLAGATGEVGNIAVTMALFFFGALVLGLHYLNFNKLESRPKLMVETWIMIVFVTWVIWYTGKIQSSLLNLYLLPIIASALIFGKLPTALKVGAIIACFMYFAHNPKSKTLLTLPFWGELLALCAPMILVAYITTMLAADIRHAVDKIKQVSDTDELTGTYNMRAFSSMLQRAFRQAVRYGHALSVVMIDSDNLKQINDKHGHESGNRLLQHLVRCIREQLRGSDVMARLGDDLIAAALLGEIGRASCRERVCFAV